MIRSFIYIYIYETKGEQNALSSSLALFLSFSFSLSKKGEQLEKCAASGLQQSVVSQRRTFTVSREVLFRRARLAGTLRVAFLYILHV